MNDQSREHDDNVMNELMIRKRFVEHLLDKLCSRVSAAPSGSIRIVKRQGCYQYYLKNGSGDPLWKYLPRNKDAVAAQLAQKDYDRKLIAALEKQLKAIDRFLKDYDPDSAKNIYGKLTEPRQKLVRPELLSDEKFIKQWQNTPYDHMGFEDGYPEYYTARGERVRSKSEILIADALLRHNIPYRYEYPVYQNGFLIGVPDFNCLNKRTLEDYYWEHNGMMDSEKYIDRTVKKLENYTFAENFDERKLIMTFETERQPLDTRVIEEKIRRYLL